MASTTDIDPPYSNDVGGMTYDVVIPVRTLVATITRCYQSGPTTVIVPRKPCRQCNSSNISILRAPAILFISITYKIYFQLYSVKCVIY